MDWREAQLLFPELQVSVVAAMPSARLRVQVWGGVLEGYDFVFWRCWPSLPMPLKATALLVGHNSVTYSGRS